MTIRRKSLIAIIATFISITFIILAMSWLMLLGNLNKLEVKNAEKEMNRVLDVLDYFTSDLDTITSDWSSWDDTYAFVLDNNDGYLTANLGDSTSKGLRLNLMLFINTEG